MALDRDTVVSIRITDDKGRTLPKSLAVNGTLKLGAKATYADGHVGDLLTTNDVTFASRDTSTATVSGNTLTWRHGGTILVTATVNGFTSAAVSISAAYAPESMNLYPRVTGLPKTLGTDPGVMVTEPSPGTYRFKGSTTQKVDSWNSLTCSVHVDAGTYTLDASDWPYDSSSWLIGIQSTLTHDDGSGQTIAFEPKGYGPKTLKAGTLRLNIFVNTTGEVDKTFTPRLYKID